MTNEEAETTFAELTNFLEEFGLRWITDSVQDEIQLGSLVEVEQSGMPAGELKSAEKLVQPSYRRAVRKSANFLVRRDYSQKERLLMLIDTIEGVVVNANACEASVLAQFKETGGPTAIQFVSNRSNVAPILAPNDELVRRHEAGVKLTALLQELRTDINS